MIRFNWAGAFFVVALLVATCMYEINVALKTPIGLRPRLLFVGSCAGEHWQRMVEGARDAARELGVNLEVQMPTPSNLAEQQSSIVRRINPADYDGVAISPADPDSQSELIKDLASQTKLVTVDQDTLNSQRLCHVGYRQTSAGALAARLVYNQLSHSGKVALFASSFADEARNSKVTERTAGFKDAWKQNEKDLFLCPVVQVATDSDISATLADPQLVFVIALDSKAAESVLKALATLETRRLPIITFDPGQAIFDAIDDGRVCSAIFADPYRSGFTAIRRLGNYCGADRDFLPVPGIGNDFLGYEVVSKNNLAEFRPRTRS